tara:strand:+ start:5655 stop:6095 length:441 start_codon:yes stop_codon:yes gene_type:complete
MELQVRKLLESDWEFLPDWWKTYNTPAWPRDFLPGSFKVGETQEEKRQGLGGFMVCKGEDPIAAIWLWMTNSKVAFPAVVISDKSYRDTDRSDALQLLINFTTDFAEDLGYKYAFSWAKKGVLLEKYIETGYYKDESPSYELIMKF